MPSPRRLSLFAAVLLGLAGCGGPARDGLEVAVIGDSTDLAVTGNRLGLPGSLIRGATRQGLVRLDETGDLVPGIAERWIVTDDGLSYIFRIRPLDGPDGERLDAREVQRALSAAFASVEGTSLGLDLAKVRDVRAMTARVIEIRLNAPMPGMLQLLAQPELGIALDGVPTGPMTARIDGARATLGVLPPEVRGLPSQPDWDEDIQPIRLTVTGAEAAIRGFAQGNYEMVLGGTLASLPLVDLGPLSRGTIRLDSATGLFGLDVRRETGFLADPQQREALAMALDRPALISPFNIAGWSATTRMVAPGLPDDSALTAERWTDMSQEARQAEAGRRVARWKAVNGGELKLSLWLPEGPGSDILFTGLAQQYGAIGITLVRAVDADRSDLALRDRVARYPGARWFLNQFHCGVSAAVCAPDVDFLVDLAASTTDSAERASYIAEAETALANTNVFIPIGAPVRWSLVRSGVQGFAENPWAIHPLFPLARAPI